MVNFQKQFIEEKFGITHVKGLIGNSMGGFEVLTWGCVYPDSVDFIISLVSSFKVGGHNYALSKIMNNILISDPDYNDGAYDLPLSDSLKRSLKLSSDAMYCYGLSREEYRNNMSNEEIELAMAEFAEESLEEDPNDLIYMNNSSLDYDLTDQLENITAKVLIIAINQDQYFPPNLDAIPMSKMIKDNKLLIFDSCMGHVGSNELFKVKEDLEEFIKEFRDI
jgi:homoserine O-acetyltransferase